MNKPIVIDLFCGAGGMSEGLIQSDFHIVFSSDVNEFVQKTYMNRHEQIGLNQGVNTHFERSDIRELNGDFILNKIQNLEIYKNKKVPEIDAIFGGPPCQGFSRAGLRKKNDPRNMLFKEYLRVIDEIKPKYVVMENVEGFLTTKLDGFVGVKGDLYPDNTLVPEILAKEFVRIGYNTLEPKILDASDYGVPQRRRRIIYIAYRDGQNVPSYPTPTTPLEEQKVSVLEAISDLILDTKIEKDIKIQSKYIMDSKKGRTFVSNTSEIHNHELSKHNDVIRERLSLYNDGESAKNVEKRLLKEGFDIEKTPNLLEFCVDTLKGKHSKKDIIKKAKNGELTQEIVDVVLTKKNSRKKLDRNKPASTILTSGDDYVSPFENRGLTVREMARLQSFDDSFVFLGKRTTGGLKRRVEVPQYTQVGNAVPPLLAKAIASELKKSL